MKTKLTWLVGCLCLAVALWLGFGVPGDRPYKESPMELNGRVTKPYPRDHDPRMKGRAKNPREEFDAARKRGMTEQEVRWVVEDFLKTGILAWESVQADQLIQTRDQEYEWYLGTLVEGFGLTRLQRKEAQTTLGKIKAAESERFLGEIMDAKTLQDGVLGADPFKEVDDPFAVVPGDLLRRVSVRAQGEKILPWNLCTLNESQKSMVPLRIEGDFWVWDSPGSVTLDYGTEKRYEGLDDPFTDPSIFLQAGNVFPLSMAQVDGIREAKDQYDKKYHNGVPEPPLLDIIKFLTSPQLRTLLLHEPEMAGTISKELRGRRNKSSGR